MFRTTSAGIVAEPNQIAILIGHLVRYTDLVAVEVVGLFAAFAFFGCPVADLCQGFVAVGIGVDIGIPASQTNPSSSSRLSEKQKPRTCVPHTPYVGIGGFMRVTACYLIVENLILKHLYYQLI